MWSVRRKNSGFVYLTDTHIFCRNGQLSAHQSVQPGQLFGPALEEVLKTAQVRRVDVWLSGSLAPALTLPEGFALLSAGARQGVLEELAVAVLNTPTELRLDMATGVACALSTQTLQGVRAAARAARVAVSQISPLWAHAQLTPEAGSRNALVEWGSLTSLERHDGRLKVQTQRLPKPGDATVELRRWRTAALLAQREARLWATPPDDQTPLVLAVTDLLQLDKGQA